MLVAEDLVIGFRGEARVFSFVLRADGFAEVVRDFGLVFFRIANIRVQVEQAADQLAQFLVVVE